MGHGFPATLAVIAHDTIAIMLREITNRRHPQGSSMLCMIAHKS